MPKILAKMSFNGRIRAQEEYIGGKNTSSKKLDVLIVTSCMIKVPFLFEAQWQHSILSLMIYFICIFFYKTKVLEHDEDHHQIKGYCMKLFFINLLHFEPDKVHILYDYSR